MASLCVKCGSVLLSGSAICTGCGTEQQAQPDPQPEGPAVRQPHIWMQDDPEAASRPFHRPDPQKQTSSSGEQPTANAPNVNAGVQLSPQLNSGIMPSYKRWSPFLAAFFSLLIPGLGQFYKGRIGFGVFWFLAVLGGYAIFGWPALILHILCIAAAASGDPYRR